MSRQMFSMFTVFVLMVLVGAGYTLDTSTGSFWQITDIHYDANYSVTDPGADGCHPDLPPEGSSPPRPNTHGPYGDYRCDSPWRLVVSAIDAMKGIQPNPDFILWTGDSVPHVSDSTLSPTKVLSLVHNVTVRLRETFTDTPIFPVLGNHDSWPSNQLPADPDQPEGFYDSVLYSSGWAELLDSPDAKATFQKGGYYSLKAPSGQTILGLNTVLMYTEDAAGADLTDPAGQLAWLKEQLETLRENHAQAYIVSHVPPGTMARAPMQWFRPKFNKHFLEILQKYSDCILAAIFGHEHTDSFRVVYHEDVPVVPMFLAPAVTPWKSSVPGIGANNPSVRLYTYERSTGRITDYHQYYLNMSAANSAATTRGSWELEYSATAAFSLTDVGADQLHSLATRLSSDDAAFADYFRYNSVSHDLTSSCDRACRRRHVCAITRVAYPAYARCVTPPTADSHFPAEVIGHHGDGLQASGLRGDQTPVYMYFVIVGVITLVCVMMFTTSLLCCRNRRQVNPVYFGHQSQYVPINA